MKLKIDGKETEVKPGTSILEAAQATGVLIPRYCYHPSLSVAGNCRICLVEIEGAPKLVTACSTPCAEGMSVLTSSEKVRAARRDVMEFLLINHPLDCPICDQAGECGLQDYYMEHGLHKSRFPQTDKVRRHKRRDVGRYLVLDNERCILCTRCVRFCEEITRTDELCVRERGDHSYIDLKPGARLDNDYSLNIADICPVGAFTSADFRFKKRVWFLERTPSVCAGCATGCPIEVHHKDNIVYRLMPRPEEGFPAWLCDEGRMTYKSLRAPGRPAAAFCEEGNLKPAAGLRFAASRLGKLKPEQVAIFGSPFMSLEDNLALAELAAAIGTKNFCLHFSTEPGIKDGILKNTDHSPNSRGLALIHAVYGGYTREQFSEKLASGEVKFILGRNEEVKAALIAARTDIPSSVFSFSDDPAPGRACVLPAAGHFESDCLFINYAGRLRRARAAVKAPEGVLPVWQAADRIASMLGAPIRLETRAAVLEKLRARIPELADAPLADDKAEFHLK